MFLFELSFPKPTPFELKKSFPDKNRVLTYKKDVSSLYANRDFKIGHYGRLGRLDAYTGGLGP